MPTGDRGRGGARSGQPGQAYTNRTDLNAKPRQAAAAGPSQGYGQRAELMRAQQALPLPAPGPSLNDPTERPDEHPMTGAPMGPGAGPEVLPMSPQQASGRQDAPLTPRDRLQ